MVDLGNIHCCECGTPVRRTGHSQKYCIPCSEKKSDQRKTAWGKSNKRIYTRAKLDEMTVARSVETLAQRAAGIKTSVAHATGALAAHAEEPELEWLVRFAIPYMQSASKNYIFGFSGKRGHVFKRKESSNYQDMVALKAREAVRQFTVRQNKVWIDLFIQKPNHKSDPINVIDLVADGIKVGIGVDDRWFAIRRLDWEIVKENPKIYIGIGQEAVSDAQACSYCGQVLPLTDFTLNKSNINGRARICRPCKRGQSKTRQQVRSEGEAA